MSSKVPVKSIVWNATSNPLLSSGWTEVLASLPFSASHFEVYTGSTTPLQIAVGPAGNEEALEYTVIGGSTPGPVKQSLGTGARLSVKPIDSNISDGFIVINLFTEVT